MGYRGGQKHLATYLICKVKMKSKLTPFIFLIHIATVIVRIAQKKAYCVKNSETIIKCHLHQHCRK